MQTQHKRTQHARCTQYHVQLHTHHPAAQHRCFFGSQQQRRHSHQSSKSKSKSSQKHRQRQQQECTGTSHDITPQKGMPLPRHQQNKKPSRARSEAHGSTGEIFCADVLINVMLRAPLHTAYCSSLINNMHAHTRAHAHAMVTKHAHGAWHRNPLSTGTLPPAVSCCVHWALQLRLAGPLRGAHCGIGAR